MDNTLFYLAQASAPQGSPLMQFLPFILLMVGFWFLLIQPQRKKQKEHQKMLTELKPGDKVVTAGGIVGTIVMATVGAAIVLFVVGLIKK